jgi:hypothetical protein
VLRHGRSAANAKGLIVSHVVSTKHTDDPVVATTVSYTAHGTMQDNGVKDEYGLTAEGASQAEAAG